MRDPVLKNKEDSFWRMTLKTDLWPPHTWPALCAPTCTQTDRHIYTYMHGCWKAGNRHPYFHLISGNCTNVISDSRTFTAQRKHYHGHRANSQWHCIYLPLLLCPSSYQDLPHGRHKLHLNYSLGSMALSQVITRAAHGKSTHPYPHGGKLNSPQLCGLRKTRDLLTSSSIRFLHCVDHSLSPWMSASASSVSHSMVRPTSQGLVSEVGQGTDPCAKGLL